MLRRFRSAHFIGRSCWKCERKFTRRKFSKNVHEEEIKEEIEKRMKWSARKHIIEFIRMRPLFVTGFSLFTIFVIGAVHYSNPDGSMIDNIHKIVNRGVYRNYYILSRGTVVSETGPKLDKGFTVTPSEKLSYLPPDSHFELNIPDIFLQPGLKINDSATLGVRGIVRISDPRNVALKVSWENLDLESSTLMAKEGTTVEEILKAAAYYDHEFLQATSGDLFLHRVEHINKENKLDPIPCEDENPDYGNMVCIVREVHDQFIQGRYNYQASLYFIQKPFLFTLELNYPPEMVKLSESLKGVRNRSEVVQQEYQNYGKIQNASIIDDNFLLTDKAEELAHWLRNQLVQIHQKSKFQSQ